MTIGKILLEAWNEGQRKYLGSDGYILGSICSDIYNIARSDSLFLHEGFFQYFVSGPDRVFISLDSGGISYFSIIFNLDNEAGFGKILISGSGHSLMLNGADYAMPKAIAAAKRVKALAEKGDWNYEPSIQ